jgi:nitroreductase/FMN reductase [NAD(P)H]
MSRAAEELASHLQLRYGETIAVDPATPGLDTLARMAGRRSLRAYTDRPVDGALLRLLCAVALSAPSKNDLQQRDIVVVDDLPLRKRLTDLVKADNPFVDATPAFLVFLGNNRRQRQVHEWRNRRFANDHLDAFFYAAVDAGIALAAFVTAAEAVGLGCCPISAIRNHAQTVSDLLGLPDHVFPVAGMTVGWPAHQGAIVPRLPLAATLHANRFSEAGIRDHVAAYDTRRNKTRPFPQQRYVADYGTDSSYGWSEDKARQYSKPERTDFGAFVRRKGFKLD